MTYANPVWQRYNEGLTRITDEDKAIGPIIALNCGHFIQKDGPRFVSDEMVSLLDRVVNRVDQVSERVSGWFLLFFFRLSSSFQVSFAEWVYNCVVWFYLMLLAERERYRIVDELQHPEIRREMVRHSTEYGI
jgi:hypothetical protein